MRLKHITYIQLRDLFFDRALRFIECTAEIYNIATV